MLAAIMFTDIQGFSEKMNRRESMGFRLLQKHNDIMDGAIAHHRGHVVKTIGDSYMVTFDSVVDAVQCAVDAQEEFARVNREGGLSEPLLVRISIHLGDVVVRGGDIFGDGVNLASHLQEVTPGGAICVSQEVYSEVRGKISADFKNLGFCRIGGVAEPIEVFQITSKGRANRMATPFAPRPATAVIRMAKRTQSRWLFAAVVTAALLVLAWILFK